MNELIDKIENLSKVYEALSSIPTKIFGPDFNEIQVGNPVKDLINSEKFEELKKVAVEAKAAFEKDFLYWVKDKDGREIGPLDIERLHIRKRMGDLTRDTPLRVKGSGSWTTAGDPTLNLGLFDDVKPQETAPALYYIHANGKQWGSFTIDQMRSWAIDGHLKPNTNVWKTGMPGWGTASQIPELASLISSPISARSR
jgi:hypothetical protein